MTNHELKQHKAEILDAFLDQIKVKSTDPRDFILSYAETNPRRVGLIGRLLYLDAMEVYLRGHCRTKAGEMHCQQMELWPSLFQGGPVAIPTAEGGYISAGKATVAQWEFLKGDHLTQIEGHQASIRWIEEHIAKRRDLKISDDISFYDWQRSHPEKGGDAQS